MRKFLKFAFVGAIALTGFGFTSCSSDEDFDETTTLPGEAVKTAFTISIDNVKAPATKQTLAEAQVDNAFKGMSEIVLFPATAAITTGSTLDLGKISLANFDAFDATNDLPTVKAKVYTDVAIPVGTTDFLFYAATGTGNQPNGALTATYSTTNNTTAGITFDLAKIQGSKTVTDEQTDGAAILQILNDVDAALTTQINAANTDGATAMETILKNAQTAYRYSDGAATPTYKAYAGSSKSVKAMLEDLYNTAKTLATTYTAVATYPNAIATAIETAFTATAPVAPATEYTLAWKTDPDFPNTAYSLPDGSVAVKFNSTTGKFAYDAASVDGLSISAISKYTKPAKLYYTINSKGMVRDEVYLSTAEAKAKTDWDGSTGITAEYTEAAVKQTTQSVILKDKVQYAVGRFDVKVRAYNEGNDITDGRTPTADVVTIPATGYPVTGVLVGGQKQVGWNFQPVSGAEELTIYDKTVQSNEDGSAIYAVKGTAYSKANSTLVLETAETTIINVAVEFENTGDDFIGVNGMLIPKGTKFYLVGQLNPAGKTRTKVFEQDYITTAELTIKDLKNAYNIVPDLRSPKLEFGFAVNLEWQTGNTFTVNFQ